MPGLSHFITGFLVSAVLFNADSKRYTKKHAFLFMIACYGPDFAQLLPFSAFDHRFGHSVLGWALYCIWLVPAITYLFRFTINHTTHRLVDEGQKGPHALQWWQVYLVMIAGGLFHFTVDITMETKHFWPLPLDDPIMTDILFFRDYLADWSLFQNIPEWLSILPTLMILIFCIIYEKQLQKASETGKKTELNLYILGFFAFFFLNYLLLGNLDGENDLGAISYFGLFFILPLLLCLFSRNPIVKEFTSSDPSSNEVIKRNEIKYADTKIFYGIGITVVIFMVSYIIVEQEQVVENIFAVIRHVVFILGMKFITYKDYNANKGEFKLKLAILLLLICSLILILAPILAYTFLYDLVSTVPFLVINLSWLSIVVWLLGAVVLICAIAFIKRSTKMYFITDLILLLTSIVVIPLVVFFLIHEKEVLDQLK